jgi:hypothetical protein
MTAKFTLGALAALLLLQAGALQAAEQKSGAQTPLTIYHIEGRRSERIVWLCEELGLSYKLEFKRGDVPGSMQAIRQVSPLMPVAPTVRYGDQVIVESAGIIEMLLARHGAGRLRPAVDSPDFPYSARAGVADESREPPGIPEDGGSRAPERRADAAAAVAEDVASNLKVWRNAARASPEPDFRRQSRRRLRRGCLRP